MNAAPVSEATCGANAHDSRVLLNDVPSVLRRLSIGRSTLYELMASGRIHAVKLGAKTLVPESELQRFASSLQRATGNRGRA